MESHIQYQSFTIKQLSNKELLSHTKLLVQKERNIHIQVLHHLAEIDSRKLFFRQGFFSLFDYAVRELSYSEGAAYRRIKAMKLCRDLPETANRLQSGKLSLSAASQLQIFFEKQDQKKHDPRRKNTRQRKEEKVQENSSIKKQEFKNKSVELAVTFAPKLRQKDEIPEHLEALSEKPVTSSKKSEQINQCSKEKATFALRPKHQIKKISRSIPSHLRKYIWERDGSQCTYIHHETKRRCASRHLLQIDHIQPFALGERSEKENLRLLCAGHNQYRR